MEKRNVLPMLIVLYISAFLAAFNENTVNVALVDIMAQYQVTAQTAQWLVTGYMIVCAIVTTITAFLLKRFTLRSIFFSAAALLGIGSLASMFAPTFPLLLVSRMFQGIGSGIFIPATMTTVLLLAPHNKLGTYLSIGSCMITLGPAFAPVITGVLDTAFGWHFVFLPAVVLCPILVVLGAFFVRNIQEPQLVKLDILSVILSALGLSAFVMGISQIFTNIGEGLALLALGLVVIAAFCIRQNRTSHALLDLTPMKNPMFSLACVLVIVAMMMLFSLSVLLPLYYEAALGMSAREAGFMLIVPILFNALFAVVGGRTMDHKGAWPLLPLGFGCATVGLLTCGGFASAGNTLLVFVGSIIGYGSVGSVLSPSQTAALSVLPREQNESGVAIVNTFVQIAACIGPSLFIGVMTLTGAQAAASNPALSESMQQSIGFVYTMVVAAGIAFAAAILAVVYSRKRITLASKKALETSSEANEVAPTVIQVMQEPFTVGASDSIKQVMHAMVALHTSGLPVVDSNNKMVGFISDGDIMAALGQKAPTGLELAYGLNYYANDNDFKQRLDEVMSLNVMELATQDIVSVNTTTSLRQACEVLSKRRIKKLPVLKDGVLVGTLSRSNIVRTLMNSYVTE